MIPLFKVAMNGYAGDAVKDVLYSGYIGQGPKEAAFEEAFSRFVGADVLMVNSCTSALELALHLAGVGPGDEVISTPMTCTATNGAIVHQGARIVWADVHPSTGLIDPIDVAKKVTRRTRAIMAVDWGGRLCDYPALRSHGLPVIEDAAHRLQLGAERGDYVCWSFQAIKFLTCGDGGALLTPPEQRERARLLRWYGIDRRQSGARIEQPIEEAGWKYHMNDIAAAIGLANLELAIENQQRHAANATGYLIRLDGLPGIRLSRLPGVTVPPLRPRGSSWWLFTLLVEERDAFIAYMAGRGIECSRVHARNDTHPAFRFENVRLPGVDYFDAHQVAIPVGWWLSEADRAAIVDAVREWARR